MYSHISKKHNSKLKFFWRDFDRLNLCIFKLFTYLKVNIKLISLLKC